MQVRWRTCLLGSLAAACLLSAPLVADVLEEWQVTTHPNEDSTVDWSADGTQIIYDHWVGGASGYDIWASPATGGMPQPLVTGPGNQNLAEWSPDDTRIVFMSDHGGNSYDLYVAPVEGGAWLQLTSGPEDDWQPSWSPDSEWIAFNNTASGNWDIWLVRADGSAPPVPFTTHTSNDFGATWSPDGTEIAFLSGRDPDPSGDIWRMPVAGGEAVQVTTTPGLDAFPDWSADDLIAFRSGRSGNSDIWVIPADGSAPAEQVTFWREDDDQATWSPDGSSLAYHSTRSGNYDVWACIYDSPVAVPAAHAVSGVVLGQNQPNPFRPSTAIRIHVEKAVTGARLDIFDVLGRRVRSMPIGNRSATTITTTWDGRDARGHQLPSGTYFYQLVHSAGVSEARKAVLMK